MTFDVVPPVVFTDWEDFKIMSLTTFKDQYAFPQYEIGHGNTVEVTVKSPGVSQVYIYRGVWHEEMMYEIAMFFKALVEHEFE